MNTSEAPLELLDRLVFKVCGLELSQVAKELEGQEYFAHNFQLSGLKIKFRVAKITPKKTGQFVSLWKRNKQGNTTPLDVADDFDFCLVMARKDRSMGVFIFPKTVLHQKGVLSDATGGGKRGMRVYPTWDVTTNKQAEETQLWQTDYFLEVPQVQVLDLSRTKNLFH